MKIVEQITALTEHVANQDLTEAWELGQVLLARRLTKEQRSEVENLMTDVPEPEAPAQNQSEQLKKYKETYVLTIAASGAKSLSNGDALAKALEGKDQIEVMGLADRFLPLPGGLTHAEKYMRLNPGSQRMNAGNKLRGAIKRGELFITDAGELTTQEA